MEGCPDFIRLSHTPCLATLYLSLRQWDIPMDLCKTIAETTVHEPPQKPYSMSDSIKSMMARWEKRAR
jgi:HD-like signal output (HDOD) protein